MVDLVWIESFASLLSMGPIKLPPNISSCALLIDLRSPWLAEENPGRAQVEREVNYKIEGF